jgi:hypothetical protein
MPQRHPLQKYAEQVAKRLAKGQAPQLSEEARFNLEDHPEWLPESLAGLLEASPTDSGEVSWLFEAYSLLLGHQLECLRYQVDRGFEGAIELTDRFQQEVVRLAREERLSHSDLTRIAVLLRDAKLPPSPELFEVASDLLEEEPPTGAELSDIPHFLQELAQQSGDDVYQIAQNLTEATYAMPPEALAMLAGLILDGSYGPLAEAVPLLMLNDRPEVREQVTEVLQQHAKQCPPIGLRRVIALRNWLPENERSRIDQIVKTARRHGIECAPWPEPRPAELYASVVDGSGAQGFIILVKQGRKFALSSLLTRLQVGILDAWTQSGLSARERNSLLSQIAEQTPLQRISPGYLDQALQHHLAAVQDHQTVPPIGLLEIAEKIGTSPWQPQKLNVDAAIAGLLPELPEDFQNAKAVEGLLKDSAAWAAHTGITDSWFEDDQEVAELLMTSRSARRTTLSKRVLEKIIESRRDKWAERCVWAALWCREASDALHSFWPNFVLVAKTLREHYPLKKISLMTEIADRTASVVVE